MNSRGFASSRIHCTLTSEWSVYRWGPVAGKLATPGLTDSEGCLWHSPRDVVAHATPDEVETELHAQLDRCLTLGLKPTHLDTHMGTVYDSPEFLDRYIKVGAENGIPLMVPGGHAYFLSKESPEVAGQVRALGEKVWALWLPVLDDLHTGYGCEDPKVKKAIEEEKIILTTWRELKPRRDAAKK